MKRLLIFNPDNDMALADGGANYMPPRIIRRMAEDLAILPAWMAESGDAVVAASAYNDRFLREANGQFGLGVSLVTPPELQEVAGEYRLSPWGWSPALCLRLRKQGVQEELLPDSARLERLRLASHRQTAVNILASLKVDGTCGESRLLRSVEECRDFVNSGQGRLLKAPLSGSGKGLNWCPETMTAGVEGWCRQVIERQGAVVGEPVYTKLADFAMEFLADGKGEPRFIGYSLFTTSRSGSYEGNLLMSDEEIEIRLAEMVAKRDTESQQAEMAARESLHAIREALPPLLLREIGDYEGYVGVDMMVCDVDGAALIHPCVEVNLRANMGVLSHYIYKMYMSPTSRGTFRLDFHSKAGEALEVHQRMMAEHPASIVDGKLVSGYLALTPVTKETMYLAYTIIK
jgi:hypothetical protein